MEIRKESFLSLYPHSCKYFWCSLRWAFVVASPVKEAFLEDSAVSLKGRILEQKSGYSVAHYVHFQLLIQKILESLRLFLKVNLYQDCQQVGTVGV